jgi:hypothetical protein
LKKFFGSHRILSIILATALVMVMGVGVYAAVLNLTFHNTVTIVSSAPPAPSANITATYAIDGGAPVALTNGATVKWGNVAQGGTQTMTITFSNSGNASGNETIGLPAATNGGAITADATTVANSYVVAVPAASGSVNGSNTATLTLTIDPAATTGTNIVIGDVTITGS